MGGAGNSNEGLHAYIGDGEGNWVEQSTGLATTEHYSEIELGDLNKDGNLDLIAGGWSFPTCKVYTGNGGAGGSMVWTEQTPPPGSWNGG